MDSWSKDWQFMLRFCDKPDNTCENSITPYALQFANCDRIEKNDAVYIFDEVGSGKTIMAGLMALHYLYNNPGKRILVITTPTMARSRNGNTQGQFLDDWISKLRLEKLGLNERVSVINNHFSNIEKSKGEWGLVIIDEAHRFLNCANENYRRLVNGIRAYKVVFLTATPVKNGPKDLDVYVGIAKAITGNPNLPNTWIPEILTGSWTDDDASASQSEEPLQKLICGYFDTQYPVTRYFKDTICALGERDFKKAGPRRLLADTWECDTDDKRCETILNNILSLYKKNQENRFLVFVRLVDDEAKKIEKYFLDSKKFVSFSEKENNSNSMTLSVITGANSGELKDYNSRDPSKLPTVLILTFQTSEQGVNLPGFNHVINYHIPLYPSSLEQRYGRVDRINSERHEVYIHYLILSKFYDDARCRWDTYTFNFHNAIWSYTHELLKCLPAKNAILTKEILEKYIENTEIRKQYMAEIKRLESPLESPEVLLKLSASINSTESISEYETDDLVEALREFAEDQNIDFKASNWKNELQSAISNQRSPISRAKQLSEDELRLLKVLLKRISGNGGDANDGGFANVIGDKIFYLKKDVSSISLDKDNIGQYIGTIDAIGDEQGPESGCTAAIFSSESYKNFLEKFKQEVGPIALFTAFEKKLEEIFEQRFMDNRLEDIFDEDYFRSKHVKNEADREDFWRGCVLNKDGAKAICQEAVDEAGSGESATMLFDILCKNNMQLPFFQMCKSFEEILIKHGTEWDRESKIRKMRSGFKKNPFLLSLQKLYQIVEEDSPAYQKKPCWKREMQLREKIKKSLFDFSDISQKTDTYCVIPGTKIPKAVNWMRLIYLLTCHIMVENCKRYYKSNYVTLCEGFLFQASGKRRGTDHGLIYETLLKFGDIDENWELSGDTLDWITKGMIELDRKNELDQQ